MAHGILPSPRAQRTTPDRANDRAPVVATFRPYRRKVTVVGIAIVVTSGLGVVNPLLIKRMFDNGLFGIAREPANAAACLSRPPRSCTSGRR